jgi:transcriptional regulator with XRE-family HTH domain
MYRMLYNVIGLAMEQSEGELIGKRVRDLREERKLSYRALAARTNGAVSHGWIAQLEQGLVPRPGIGKVIAVAAGLRVPVVALLDEEHRTYTPPPGTADIFDQLRDMPLDEEDTQELLSYADYLVERRQRKRRKQRVAEAPGESDPAVGEAEPRDNPGKLRVVAEEPEKYTV